MFLSKKTKKTLAFAMSLSILATAMVPVTASADSGTFNARTKAEKYGDSTYADRFMSLYADVIEEGVENGYLSSQGGKEIPYHAVETLNVEAPDYGHETTSEAMSYLVWIAAMRDNIVNNGLTTADVEKSSTLADAWSDMETMIPTVQTGFWEKASQGQLSATYNDEWDEPETYPTDMQFGNSGVNPIQTYFTQAYSSDKGLYLLHWLADVNDWYGYGGAKAGTGTGTFTFINTFQRGSQESCWETVPHPCVEELKYGNSRGIKGIFSTEATIAKQWAYTNAPDAEDRAIQGVYAANRWGVGDSSVTTLAGKMGDQLRNNFFDKYYKAISTTTTKNSPSTGYESSHYLRNWYTSWGGALDGSWAWQIGCSHVHEFYQNPLATYALLADSDLNSAMKAQDATKDYQTSLARQLEFYLWLQSNDGPIAGGATNSLYGRYEDYSKAYTLESDPNQLVTSTFYNMIYVEHPVYNDPGSNHWIGNQVWALQRIAELYYDVAVNGDKSGVTLSDGTTVEQACAKIMDKWAQWSIENIKFDEDALAVLENYDIDQTTDGGADTTTWAIPGSLDWSGQPDTWTGSATDNTGLTCTVTAYSREVGSSASWANGLVYYAAACGVDTNTTATADELIASDNLGEKALGVAKKILDYQWEDCRDDIGLTVLDINTNLKRFFEQSVWVPTAYGTGTMPDGSTLSNGATFLSIRQSYKNDPDYARLEADYKDDGETADTEFYYHRFWHEGDAMMANGTIATLFPELTPVDVVEDIKIEQDTIELEVGETDKIIISSGTADSFTSADESIATVDSNGTVTGVAPGTTTVTVTDAEGNTDTVTVIVTEVTTATTTEEPATDILWGDVNVDGQVRSNDMLLLKKYLLGLADVTDQGLLNADVTHDGSVKSNDLLKLKKFLLGLIDDLGPEA